VTEYRPILTITLRRIFSLLTVTCVWSYLNIRSIRHMIVTVFVSVGLVSLVPSQKTTERER
jgi:hypothetical protein